MSAKTDAVFKKFEEVGIIPVVVLNDVKDAEPLGKALMEGGLPAAEVTFRTAAAEESIRIMAEKFPDMLVGAGTVLTIDQVDRAVAAGAKFIVAPGLDEEIVKYCLEKDIPVCPGTQTASEMMKAIKLGLTHVKFFPAENAGGLSMIKAIGAALTALRFMPTGGINATNVVDYLKNDKIFCCGGSWMVKGDMIKAGQFEEIKAKVAEAAEIVKANRA
ncbi:MAG: bifunctional 4-hydroxy-2-oxoglutarate aldolase/2-dehydro-3-deoxy-phosphogluconate aldolase [Lachnospiraceae bacterium]|nr:bifunctional 4-hydroxy-2-oxoglutarate aldolase/2-dehydro-3-deoxy-phosphogluconate aldolase [Lachnospiraceae bacterium]